MLLECFIRSHTQWARMGGGGEEEKDTSIVSTRRKGKEILGGLKKKIITLAEKTEDFNPVPRLKS